MTIKSATKVVAALVIDFALDVKVGHADYSTWCKESRNRVHDRIILWYH